MSLVAAASTGRRSLDTVHELACDLIGLGGRRARRLHARRRDALDEVLAEADRLGGDLRGSWRWGDFHLDERSCRSRSDIDLFGGDAPPGGWAATDVGPLRVATHAVDYEAAMSPRVSCAFALVNLAAARLAPDADPYVVAKCRLMLARTTVRERYADVARRVGGPAGAWLLASKLGIALPPPRGSQPSVPIAAAPGGLEAVLDRLLRGRPSRGDLERLRTYIADELDELDERHRRYVAGKVDDLLART